MSVRSEAIILSLVVLCQFAEGQFTPSLHVNTEPVDSAELDWFSVWANDDSRISQGDWFSTGNHRPQNSLVKLAAVPVSLENLWMTDSETGLVNYQASLKFPMLKWFGSPPPIVKTGFKFTELFAADDLELPNELYEYSVGVSWVRKINQRWTLRGVVGIGYATDQANTTSDSWRFRGGAFGVYRARPNWQWTVGAIALGRDDLPVVPAIGAVWNPSPNSRWDLILPNPKISLLVSDDGQRQNWIYIGGGFNGTTWGYESASIGDDRLTYNDLRLVTGWRSQPSAPTNVPFVRGRKFGAEAGYAFSRDLEFNDESTKISLDNAALFRLFTEY